MLTCVSRLRRGLGALLGLGLLAGCINGAGPAGDVPNAPPGLGLPIARYYDRWALEENGRCRWPSMLAITAGQVIEDTPERIVVVVGYTYRDFDYERESPIGGIRLGCQGFGNRRFVVDKTGEGYRVARMSGPSAGRQGTNVQGLSTRDELAPAP
ncbi:hypothetical protein [Marinivivus vitaminiproducens]|uniref:hypothetical protein n=1 Tax=Marinivivus vitaminiproducens TaxID=3035935 RepID=UPI00279862A8|nr:hypothetical protein P4R82_07895 [Geminicoccaceae bacterium SCSIO 64248]